MCSRQDKDINNSIDTVMLSFTLSVQGMVDGRGVFHITFLKMLSEITVLLATCSRSSHALNAAESEFNMYVCDVLCWCMSL